MVAKKSSSLGSKKKTSHVATTSELYGWQLNSWVESAATGRSIKAARVLVVGVGADYRSLQVSLAEQLHNWQQAQLKENNDLLKLSTEQGPLWLVRLRAGKKLQAHDSLGSSTYASARDILGRCFSEIEQAACDKIEVEFVDASEEEIHGALVGLDLAAYSYKKSLERSDFVSTKLYLKGPSKAQIKQASLVAKSVNIARHLVNAPANLLNPTTYAKSVKALFAAFPSVKVEHWDTAKLKKENMNLILAVGQAAEHGPCLVKLSYRPKGVKSKSPIAIVGKGITFDSGGLDIKPPAGMRLMKKDMGGSAAAIGFFYWVVASGQKQAMDVYLPMAENAISSNAFRPGDIFVSRSGKKVEIHNTDAEGRLILADALSLACESAPSAIICLATLTGAAKVAVGNDLTAYFSNDDRLAKQVEQGAYKHGDLVWRLPLFDAYKTNLRSNVADINHCASWPFAGSITAALFLAEFVESIPLMHFDLYAWNDKPKGALRESGGSGQGVQSMIGLFENYLEGR